MDIGPGVTSMVFVTRWLFCFLVFGEDFVAVWRNAVPGFRISFGWSVLVLVPWSYRSAPWLWHPVKLAGRSVVCVGVVCMRYSVAPFMQYLGSH